MDLGSLMQQAPDAALTQVGKSFKKSDLTNKNKQKQTKQNQNKPNLKRPEKCLSVC
jgi:hypothetical protein